MDKVYVIQEIDCEMEEFPVIQIFKDYEKAVQYFDARKNQLVKLFAITRDFARDENELATMFQKNEDEVNYLLKLTKEQVRD